MRTDTKRINLIGAPMDLGADRRGVDMGPSAIRYADLGKKLEQLGYTVRDLGSAPISNPEMREVGDPNLKYLDPIVAGAEWIADRVRRSITEDKAIPLILGGDHSIALGSVSGVASAYGEVGVIWFDAHGDYNTSETTPSGNIHGMALAALAGLGDPRLVNIATPGPHVDPRRIVIVGARDLDAEERVLLRDAGVHVRTIAEVDRRGIAEVTQEALRLAGRDADGVHISFDMDVMDPAQAPGVGTPVPGGMTYREAHLAMEVVAESGRMVSMDLVEVNPILDHENHTAILATELALSAFGKRIF